MNKNQLHYFIFCSIEIDQDSIRKVHGRNWNHFFICEKFDNCRMNLILKFMITTAILENTVLLSLSTINKLKIKKMKDGRPIWTVQIEIIHSPAVRNHFLSENPNIILISTKIYKNIVYYQVEFLLFSEVRF